MVSKKILITLVIISILLAIVSLNYGAFSFGEKISTQSNSGDSSSEQGKVGIEIMPPVIEDKLEQES